MVELIEQPFNYGTNSSIPSLWASMGYTYGQCARKLHYANKYGRIAFTPSEKSQMETGIETHELVEKWFLNQWPDASISSEVKKSFGIDINGQPFIIGAKADLIASWHPNLQHDHDRVLIEIKYLYGRKAYYQTLIEKLVFNDARVMCFQYANLHKPQFAKQLLIPLKADINMARVYAGRIITSLYHMPPRFPNAYYSHPTCSHCMYRERCYTGTVDFYKDLDDWESFKRHSQTYIDAIRRVA